MIDMVVGYVFNQSRTQLAMIRMDRTKVDSLRGKWNGIGGKVDPQDASPAAAMRREFHEETGVKIHRSSWTQVGYFINDDRYRVWVFRALVPDEVLADIRTQKGECLVQIASLGKLPSPISDRAQWLIPMMLDSDVVSGKVTVHISQELVVTGGGIGDGT